MLKWLLVGKRGEEEGKCYIHFLVRHLKNFQGKLSDFKDCVIMWEVENIWKLFKIFSPVENLKLQRNLVLLCPVTCRLTVNQFMDLSNDALFINSLNHMLSFLRLLITNRCLSIYLGLKKSFLSWTVTGNYQSWKSFYGVKLCL
jgi:hypothetical protein